MKIALVQAPAWGRDCPPYTMALLAAITRKAGYKTYCFDINNALYCSGPDKYRQCWDDKDLYNFWSSKSLVYQFLEDNQHMLNYQIQQILDTDANIIGFTVHFSSMLVTLEIAKRIKLADPSKVIVFGGPDCSKMLRGRELIEKDCVDVVVTGEGDYLLLEIMDQLRNKGEVEFVKGTLIKKQGSVIDCGEAEIVGDLDNLPFPDYSDFADDIKSGLYRQPERLEIFDSRGCVNRCHFCSEWQFWRRFRSMSGERMFAEIKHQMRLYPGVKKFYFIGSLINGNIKALSKFCDLIIESKTQIKWSGQPIIRPEMTKELLQKMHKAGCEWLGYGIESGSEELLHRMNKRFSVKVAERVLKDTHDTGIAVQANFMFGMPTEAETDFEKTINFLKRNRKNIDSILASQSFCVLDKGTYLYNYPEQFNIKNKDHHLYWESGPDNNYLERFSRYEEFCNVAISMGLPETSGLLKEKPDKWKLLGEYYLHKKDYKEAAERLSFASAKEPKNRDLQEKVQASLKKCYSSSLKEDSRTAKQQKKDYPQDLEQLNLNDMQLNAAKKLKEKGLTEKLRNFLIVEEQKRLKTEYVSGYPYWLTLDPSNLCNLQCPFCPTGQKRDSRTKGVMAYDDFKKIMDELGRYLIHIDFCNWGEPFTNKDIFKMISLAKQYNIDTKIDSNFTLLSKKDIDKLLESGIDKIIVSIDGLCQETYSKHRVGGDFNKAMSNLQFLLERKKQLSLDRPHITWQFLVFKHNEHEINDVRRLGQELGVDETAITKAFIGYKDWMPTDQEHCRYNLDILQCDASHERETSEYFTRQHSYCNWLWEAIVINPNGSVSPCCTVENEKDDFGNILVYGFKKIWNNEQYRNARIYMKDRGKSNTIQNICHDCKQAGVVNLDLSSCKMFDKQADALLTDEIKSKVADGNSNKVEIYENNKKLLAEELAQENPIMAGMPTSIMVILTTACNLQCIMCPRHKGEGALSYSTVSKLFTLFPYLELIEWQGGEVFLLDYFKKLLMKAAEYPQILQHITTNGLLINKDWAATIAQTRTNILFSIDAVTKKTYEFIRRGGNFDDLRKSLDIMLAAKNNYKSNTQLEINAAVMKQNYRELYLFPDFCRKHGIQCLNFDVLWPCEVPHEDIFVNPDLDAIKYLSSTMPEIEQKCKEYGIHLNYMFKNRLREVLSDGSQHAAGTELGTNAQDQLKVIKCYHPWQRLHIEPDGRVYPACQCKKPLGSLQTSSWQELWNNSTMQQYRRLLNRNAHNDICSEQCKQYSEVGREEFN